MHSEPLRRILALAQSGVRIADVQLRRAGVARSNPTRLPAQFLRRLAEALVLVDRDDG